MGVSSKTPELHSVESLLKEIKGLGKSHEWIFRGVCSPAHKLVPKIGWVRKDPADPPISVKEEQEALRQFKKRARAHLDISLENDTEWLVLGRHYGLPTRLLDWTRSPLVAAFFAVDNIKKGDYGLMYAVRQPPLVNVGEAKNPFGIKSVKLVEPPHISERVSSQSSVMTIHNNPQAAWSPADIKLFKFPPRSSLKKVKYELDDLGINYASLFPGVDGVARQISWQMKRNRLMRYVSGI